MEAGGRQGFWHAATPKEHLASKSSLAAQVPYSWGISFLPFAHVARHSHSRKHAGTEPGVHKFGWEIHIGDKNELGQHLSPLQSPRAHAQVPWCSQTCSLHHKVEFLLHPGLLQHKPAPLRTSHLGPWWEEARVWLGRSLVLSGLVHDHQDRPLILSSQCLVSHWGLWAGQSKWRNARQPETSAWTWHEGAIQIFRREAANVLTWKYVKCEALALGKNEAFGSGGAGLSALPPPVSHPAAFIYGFSQKDN